MLHPNHTETADSGAQLLYKAVQCAKQHEIPQALQFLQQAEQGGGLDDNLFSRHTIQGHFNHFGRATALATDPQTQRLLVKLKRSLAVEPRSYQPSLTTTSLQRPQHRQAIQAQTPTAPIWSALIETCLQAEDIHGAIDDVTANHPFSPSERIRWFIRLSEAFLTRKDRLTAEHFAHQAMAVLPPGNQEFSAELASHLVKVGRSDDAVELMLQHSLRQSALSQRLDTLSADSIATAFKTLRRDAQAKSQHGQALLLDYFKTHLDSYKASIGERRLVLIEIGTTREEVKGQGSTRQFAEFCKQQGLHFITIDMDPHNSRMAQRLFRQLDCAFEAITSKGEEYLREYPGPIDFIFLDAYDFDHGKHSELRQSRYQQFLGARIDDQQCHRMHLECAESLVDKLAEKGLICFDDTWLDHGKWTAKGTLAMPYLMDNGFKLIDARNRAALLARDAVRP